MATKKPARRSRPSRAPRRKKYLATFEVGSLTFGSTSTNMQTLRRTAYQLQDGHPKLRVRGRLLSIERT